MEPTVQAVSASASTPCPSSAVPSTSFAASTSAPSVPASTNSSAPSPSTSNGPSVSPEQPRRRIRCLPHYNGIQSLMGAIVLAFTVASLLYIWRSDVIQRYTANIAFYEYCQAENFTAPGCVGFIGRTLSKPPFRAVGIEFDKTRPDVVERDCARDPSKLCCEEQANCSEETNFQPSGRSASVRDKVWQVSRTMHAIELPVQILFAGSLILMFTTILASLLWRRPRRRVFHRQHSLIQHAIEPLCTRNEIPAPARLQQQRTIGKLSLEPEQLETDDDESQYYREVMDTLAPAKDSMPEQPQTLEKYSHKSDVGFEKPTRDTGTLWPEVHFQRGQKAAVLATGREAHRHKGFKRVQPTNSSNT